VRAALKESLSDLLDRDEQGRPRLTFSLPDLSAVDAMAEALSRLVANSRQPA
jgi:hypothetical protein